VRGYRLELELVAPVHVGTGETYPAYAYVPDEERKAVHLLDPGRLLEGLDEVHQRRYLEAVKTGPKGAQDLLVTWWREGRLPRGAILRTIQASKAFFQALKNAEEGLLEYRPLPASPLGPYLPGSSVKGALRTAWIFRRILQKNRDVVWDRSQWAWGETPEAGNWPLIFPPRTPSDREKTAQSFEAFVLGYLRENKKNPGRKYLDLYQDPFRAVRVADSGPLESFLNLIKVFPIGKEKGLRILAETLRIQTKVTLVLRLEEGLARHSGVSHPITAEELAKACREYYQEVMAEERKYADQNRLKNAQELYKKMEERLGQNPQAFPLRIGFGSGSLSIRLALLMDEPPPKTRKTVGAENPQDGYPLGWALARLSPV